MRASRIKAAAVILSMTFLIGCAAEYAQTPLGTGHPANPEAQPAPPAARSGTLDLSRTEPVHGAEAEPPAHGAHGTPHEKPAPGAPEHGVPGNTPAPAPAAVYSCPMHPEVTSDQPEQRCPKCGMKLVKKKEPGGSR